MERSPITGYQLTLYNNDDNAIERENSKAVLLIRVSNLPVLKKYEKTENSKPIAGEKTEF